MENSLPGFYFSHNSDYFSCTMFLAKAMNIPFYPGLILHCWVWVPHPWLSMLIYLQGLSLLLILLLNFQENSYTFLVMRCFHWVDFLFWSRVTLVNVGISLNLWWWWSYSTEGHPSEHQFPLKIPYMLKKLMWRLPWKYLFSDTSEKEQLIGWILIS